MNEDDKYSLGYAIGSSIEESKNKIEKLEKKVTNLKNKLEEKDELINEILKISFFECDCPYSLTDDVVIKELCDCDNC